MTANTQTRYDFGRCTVEHVDGYEYTVPSWGAALDSPIISMAKPGVVIRVQQSWHESPDDAQFTLLGEDARDLAEKILKALGDE